METLLPILATAFMAGLLGAGQVVVEGRLDVGSSSSGDLVDVHARQVDAEPLVVPQALVIQPI